MAAIINFWFLVTVKHDKKNKLPTAEIECTDNFSAFLPMDHIKEFHLRSEENLRPKICLKHGTSLRM